MSLKQSALLLIEFQNEWIDEKGKLHHLLTDKTQFHESLFNAERVLNAARKANLCVIHSGLSFTENYKELGRAKHGLRAVIPVNQTFLENTPASRFAAPFEPKEKEFIVRGRVGGSAFSGSNLEAYLRNNDIRTLYIMGYALHVCVESTLRAAHDLGYEAIIIDDACSAFNQEQKNYFLTDIVHHFGSNTKSQEFIANLNEGK